MAASSLQLISLIPPPPGVKSNFSDPPTQTAGTIALHTICLFFVTCCVAVRLYTRRFISHELWWDDYCCILAYVMTIIFSALLLEGNSRGLGRHLWDIPAIKVPGALKMLTVAEWIYFPLVAIIKLSCLLFYWRVFKPSPKWRWILGISMSLLVCTYIGLFFATLFECIPVGKSWKIFIKHGHCFKPKGLPYASGGINVASDIIVLVLPIPAVWSLNLKLRRKLRVIAIFSLAIFAVAASIVRLAETSILYTSTDRTWNLGKIQVWAILEVNVGIICACLLAFPAFLDRYGVVIVSKIRSYTNLLRSTGSSKAHTKHNRSNISLSAPVAMVYDRATPGNKSVSKLNQHSEEYLMQHINDGGTTGRGHNVTHRADIEYVEDDQPVHKSAQAV